MAIQGCLDCFPPRFARGRSDGFFMKGGVGRQAGRASSQPLSIDLIIKIIRSCQFPDGSPAILQPTAPPSAYRGRLP